MATKHTQHHTKKEDWMNSKWRPAMGWMYMVVCTCDFVLFPILWSLLQSISHGQVTSQWQPLTLQGAGLFHLAMGAIIGVSAYGRTQEKLGGANNGGALPFGASAGTTYVPPGQGNVNINNQPNMPYTPPYTPTPTATFVPQNNSNLNNVTTGFAGKKSPPPTQEPML